MFKGLLSLGIVAERCRALQCVGVLRIVLLVRELRLTHRHRHRHTQEDRLFVYEALLSVLQCVAGLKRFLLELKGMCSLSRN